MHHPRRTSLEKSGVFVHTVEHLMSALYGLGISNLIIEIDNEELPGLDGSALEFLKALKEAGVIEQDGEVECLTVKEPIGVELDGASIYITPADELRISYVLDYHHPILKSQFVSLVVNESTYENEIAVSRTFCLDTEAKILQEQGLGQGANYKNTLVVGENGVIENKFRFEDECARHKILDFIGDLYILGKPLKGNVYAVKSGHRLNVQLLQKVIQQNLQKIKSQPVTPDYGQYKNFNIQDIMKILPHRYPFLLVDRVIEIEQGKKAIGIKNVTINDGFFQGHFPTRPVMPGGLMIEAMAQTAGVAVLTSEQHRGKLAFFMACNNVKFRKVVTAGDQLIMEAEVIKDRVRITQVHAKARVDGEIVAEADMIFSFTDSDYLDE